MGRVDVADESRIKDGSEDGGGRTPWAEMKMGEAVKVVVNDGVV